MLYHKFEIMLRLPILWLLVSIVFCVGSVLKPSVRHQCERFNINECKRGPCEKTVEDCQPLEGQLEESTRCFVVWDTNNSTGNVSVAMKGCFVNANDCHQTECIDWEPERQNNKKFCCCTGNMCNVNHKWIPTTTTTTIRTTEVEPNDDNGIVTLIVSIVGPLVVIFAGIGCYLYYRNRKQSRFNEVPTDEPDSKNSCQALCPPMPVNLKEMIARGRFGAVWRAEMSPYSDVAVKIFPLQDKNSWSTELEIFQILGLQHENILQFIGADKRTDGYWLITDYHHNGSLCDYLKSHTITWEVLRKIVNSMALGLQHLHAEIPAVKMDKYKPTIAHRDFKSKNVLLKSDLTACIADFGLALVFKQGKNCGETHGQVGTRRYMAPEILEGSITFMPDSFLRIDIYACGLVLWELVSRCTAHGQIVSDYKLPFEKELGTHPTLEEMQENVVMKKLRPKIEDHWRTHEGLKIICETMVECWDHDCEARISSSIITERMEDAKLIK